MLPTPAMNPSRPQLSRYGWRPVDPRAGRCCSSTRGRVTARPHAPGWPSGRAQRGSSRHDLAGALDAFTGGVERQIDTAEVNGRAWVGGLGDDPGGPAFQPAHLLVAFRQRPDSD